ncbi:MAG: lysine--tRNA ligase [Patescibacteria group bacterium]
MAEPHDELTTRRARLVALRAAGKDPFPSTVERTHELIALREQFETLLTETATVSVVGRVRSIREHGGSTFMTIDDGTATMQLYCKKDDLGDDQYAALQTIDVADFVSARGTCFLTKRLEPSVLCNAAPIIITKALRPLPEKWHGLSDVEIRYRKRYLDLLVNEPAKKTALTRAALLRELRNFLDENSYIEVETPILQDIPGGATARPFMTHFNALDLDMYLRVAPELFLKRLLVGGIPKVYEIARCFRNEGIDHSHNPEFTQVEMYEAFADYEAYMRFVEKMLSTLLLRLTGGMTVVGPTGETIDFTPPYARKDWMTTLNEAAKIDVGALDDVALKAFMEERNIDCEVTDGRGTLLDKTYKVLVRPNILQPTFLIHHPVSLSPLAKRLKGNSELTERFQLVLGGGIELVNGFSELNDPDDQRERFEGQEKLRDSGDEEAHRIDENFITALEHGMPPAAGLGMGIDRLAALITGNTTLKEVILFPTLRPEAEN